MSETEITVDTYRRIKITLDMSEIDAIELADSIWEAKSLIANWRSNPAHLDKLREELLKWVTR